MLKVKSLLCVSTLLSCYSINNTLSIPFTNQYELGSCLLSGDEQSTYVKKYARNNASTDFVCAAKNNLKACTFQTSYKSVYGITNKDSDICYEFGRVCLSFTSLNKCVLRINTVTENDTGVWKCILPQITDDGYINKCVNFSLNTEPDQPFLREDTDQPFLHADDMLYYILQYKILTILISIAVFITLWICASCVIMLGQSC